MSENETQKPEYITVDIALVYTRMRPKNEYVIKYRSGPLIGQTELHSAAAKRRFVTNVVERTTEWDELERMDREGE